MSAWPQTVIALIWDFDRTLARGSMLRPLFDDYGIPEHEFWAEVNDLAAEYTKQGQLIDRQSLFLNHLLTLTWTGRTPGLNNERLRSYGQSLEYYHGMPEFLQQMSDLVAGDPTYARFGISVEHYIVSSGLRQIIQGSSIRASVRDVWASEFVEHPMIPGHSDAPIISQIAYVNSDSVKTKALFQLNKGVNVEPSIDINGEMPESERRIPFEHMVCIADGPSDVPLFAVTKRMGGAAFGVYDPLDPEHFKEASRLLEQGRTHSVFEADYRSERPAWLWLERAVRRIGDRIVEQQEALLRNAWSSGPTHVVTRRA